VHLRVLGQVENERQLHTAMICTTVAAAAYLFLQNYSKIEIIVTK
jgi:hypothetical protein